jgi:hypothetical protein
VVVSLITLDRNRQSAQKRMSLVLGDQPYHNLIVTLDFEPEAYHITLLQNKGRLVGVDGNTVQLRKVSNEDLMSLSRLTWVNTLEIWIDGGSQ